MPNHCENDLYIRGAAADVAEVLSLIGADRTPVEFDCNAIVPYPARFAEMDAEYAVIRDVHGYFPPDEAIASYRSKWGTKKDGFNSGGYEWRCDNWGTKWGAYEVSRRDYGGTCVTFQTAWCTPVPVIVALAKRFPKVTLHLEWFESGQAECGGFTLPSAADAKDYGVAHGIPAQTWKGRYLGNRGG